MFQRSGKVPVTGREGAKSGGQAISPESGHSVEILGGRNHQIPERGGVMFKSKAAVAPWPGHLPDQETMHRYVLRAAELRALAARTNDQFRRDWMIAAAESYENLASGKPPKPFQRC